MKSHSNNIKMVVMDIGKTIFDKEKQTHISEDLIETIKKLKKIGIKVGVCTMRTFDWCKKMIDIDLDFYICLNGSYVIANGKKIIDKKINNDFNQNEILTYGRKNCYYKNEESLNNSKRLGFVANKEGNLKYPYVVTLFNIDENEIDYYKEKYSIYYWPNNKCLNIQNQNTSNINALNKIKNIYKVQDYLYFGDAPNDLEIFQNNKYSILVKNGLPLLKKYAFDICDECMENGVGKYLNEFYKL